MLTAQYSKKLVSTYDPTRCENPEVWKLIFFLSVCLPICLSICLSIYTHITVFQHYTDSGSATFHHTHLSVTCFHSGHSFDWCTQSLTVICCMFCQPIAKPLQPGVPMGCFLVWLLPLTCPKLEALPVAMLPPAQEIYNCKIILRH
jgi:hypothetical protein